MERYAARAAYPDITPDNDPWDPIRSLRRHGKHVLTSVEFTVTNLCNMRCEHCAVGDSLTDIEGSRLPLPLVLRKLDEVEHLETISITGGEPSFRDDTIRGYIVPLLQYARQRGVRSQLNSNVTLDYSRYEPLLPLLDVMHISFNYETAEDFWQIGFAKTGRSVSRETAARMYERMIDNARRLSEDGMFVSAESMINYRTYRRLPAIHRLIAEMGCVRHEVHPMYPSAFAKDLPVLSLDDYREAVHALLDARDPSIWMLFGTLPFFACSAPEGQHALVRRLMREPNVTVRNDPDGRNRLNVNLFTGDVYVTDFASIPSFGNVQSERLDDIFARWHEHPLQQSVACHCPSASCCGPNLLVADTYYRGVDFRNRQARA